MTSSQGSTQPGCLLLLVRATAERGVAERGRVEARWESEKRGRRKKEAGGGRWNPSALSASLHSSIVLPLLHSLQ